MKKTVLSGFIAVLFVVLMMATVHAATLGDINADGFVNAADARLTLRAAVGLEHLNNTQTLAADADHDGRITAADARLILRNAVGLEAFVHFFGIKEDEIETITPADCGNDGCIRLYCSCGMYMENIIPATGEHRFSDEAQIMTPATCTQAGTGFYPCTVCGKRAEFSIPASGHALEVKAVAATCIAPGEIVRRCTVCDDYEREVIPATGHMFAENYTMDHSPTCIAAGSKSKHCVRCDARTDVVLLEKIPHQFGPWTSSEDGRTKTRTCLNCMKTETVQIVSSNDPTEEESHSNEEATTAGAEHTPEETSTAEDPSIKEEPTTAEEPSVHIHDFLITESVLPSCEKPGKVTCCCAGCGQTYQEPVKELGHNDVIMRSTPPTCTQSGSEIYGCTRCGRTYTDVIPALGHLPMSFFTTQTPATCTAQGKQVKRCTRCNEILETRSLPAAGHKTVFSFSSDGKTRYTICTVCGETIATERITGYCLFPNGTKTTFFNLEDALETAADGCTLVLTADYTLSRNVNVPAGVTLWISCNADTVRSDRFTALTVGEATEDVKSAYCTLSIPHDITLLVDGTLIIDAQIGQKTVGDGIDFDVCGRYGEICLEGQITVRAGGCFYCHGYLNAQGQAQGAVSVEKDGRLFETFAVKNWQGMTVAYKRALQGTWPITDYSMDKLRSTVHFCSGAKYFGIGKLFYLSASGDLVCSDFILPVLDNQSGVLRLSEGASFSKSVAADPHGKISEVYKFSGGAVFSGTMFSLTPETVLLTSDYPLPINKNTAVSLHSGEYRMTASMILQTSSAISLAEDATLLYENGAILSFCY